MWGGLSRFGLGLCWCVQDYSCRQPLSEIDDFSEHPKSRKHLNHDFPGEINYFPGLSRRVFEFYTVFMAPTGVHFSTLC